MFEPLLLIQFEDDAAGICAGLVTDDGTVVRPLASGNGVYGLAMTAIEQGCSLANIVAGCIRTPRNLDLGRRLSYLRSPNWEPI